jgi:hypothetical protein
MDDECSICLDVLYENTECILPCKGKHKFHFTCFMKYVMYKLRRRENTECPICKSSVLLFEDVQEEIFEEEIVTTTYSNKNICICITFHIYIFLLIYSIYSIEK